MDNTIYNYDYANNKAIEELIKYTSIIINKSYEETYEKYFYAKKSINFKFKGTALSHDKLLQIKYFSELINLTNVHKIDFINNAQKIYYETFLNHINTYDNLYDFLLYCNINNIKIIILTNNTLDIQLKIFELLKLKNYIDNIFTSYEIGNEKPSKECFEYIYNKYNFNKNEILMIGDSEIADYNGAIEYGFNAILFKNNYCDIIKKIIMDYK